MPFSDDGLYRFEINSDKSIGGYMLAEYLKRDDPTITELELPAEFNGKPVTMICGCFYGTFLKRVAIPPSVRYIARSAFGGSALESVKLPNSPIKLAGFVFSACKNLERVEFGSPPPELGPRVFHGCEKLPPEILAMSMTRSTDRVCRTDYRSTLSRDEMIKQLNDFEIKQCDSFRADVFEILAKNKCFKKLNVKFLFEKMINENRHDLLLIAEKYGMLDSAVLLDLLINYAIENQKTEFTAYLLDLKNRKFGFDSKSGGDKFEL